MNNLYINSKSVIKNSVPSLEYSVSGSLNITSIPTLFSRVKVVIEPILINHELINDGKSYGVDILEMMGDKLKSDFIDYVNKIIPSKPV